MTFTETMVLVGMGIILGAFAINWIRTNSQKTGPGKGGATNDGSTPTTDDIKI